MPIMTGSFPLALPGGEANVSAKPSKPKTPLMRKALAFGAKPQTEQHKRGRHAFGARGMGQKPAAFKA